MEQRVKRERLDEDEDERFGLMGPVGGADDDYEGEKPAQDVHVVRVQEYLAREVAALLVFFQDEG